MGASLTSKEGNETLLQDRTVSKQKIGGVFFKDQKAMHV